MDGGIEMQRLVTNSDFCAGLPQDIDAIQTRGVHQIGLSPFNLTVYQKSWPESNPKHKYSIQSNRS